MNKQIAIGLEQYVKTVEERYSNTEREMNFSGEKFTLQKIVPTSDQTASVYFDKSPSGKVAVAFYYIGNGANKGWRYFFPSDSHVAGMRGFEYHKFQAEEHNYSKNF